MEHEVFIVAINLGDLNVPGLVAYSNGLRIQGAGDQALGEVAVLSELEDFEEELASLGLAEEITLGMYRTGTQCSSGSAEAGVETLAESTDPSDEAPPRAA